MRVDHLVFAAEPDGLIPTAKRLGTLLGVEPTDGGLHPRFGTRNSVIPLTDHRFIEVVEVLDHPASDKAPFGQAVRACSAAGGGWLGWVVEVEDISIAERLLGRKAVPGNRHRPDGVEICWKQIGIRGLMADPQVPFFIEWPEGQDHPSTEGESTTALTGLQIAGSPDRIREWLGLVGEPGVDREEWEPDIRFDFAALHGNPGLMSVQFRSAAGPVSI